MDDESLHYPRRPLCCHAVSRVNTFLVPQVQEENPDMKITEISKVLGQLWRGMDDNQKKPFNKKAAIDKERQAQSMF